MRCPSVHTEMSLLTWRTALKQAVTKNIALLGNLQGKGPLSAGSRRVCFSDLRHQDALHPESSHWQSGRVTHEAGSVLFCSYEFSHRRAWDLGGQKGNWQNVSLRHFCEMSEDHFVLAFLPVAVINYPDHSGLKEKWFARLAPSAQNPRREEVKAAETPSSLSCYTCRQQWFTHEFLPSP